MKKIEIVWNQLLVLVLESRQTRFQLQELAKNLDISISTVHHGLKDLKRMGAVRVGGNGGEIVDAEKILMHWANNRKIDSDVVERFKVNLGVVESEKSLPEKTVLGAYSAVRNWYGEAPADYSQVYIYHQKPEAVKERFKGDLGKKTELVVLKLPEKLKIRKETTSLGHTFVDLWNLTDWMAKEFVKRVKQEIDGILS